MVDRLEGAMLALAPAGTGKTTVLTERVARAIDAGTPPERILCVTFTNRAARELRARIETRFPEQAHRLAPRTFHQLCADILRHEAKQIGLWRDFQVCDETTSQEMLRRILGKHDPDGKQAFAVYQRLQDAKQHWHPSNLRWPLGGVWAQAGFDDTNHREAARKYERGLSQWQQLDFADLVLYVRAIFAALPDVRDRWASRYAYVQVDEIQDTHLAEYEIVATLARQSGNLAVFGDRDQTIYEWRGAEPRRVLAKFAADFPSSQTFQLADNHRATRRLIKAADRFAASLTHRETKLQPAPSCAEGTPALEYVAESVGNEADWIAESVAVRHQRDGVPLPSMAVLAPTNWYCEAISRALTRHHVPHLTAARLAFFRQPDIVDALAYLRLLLHPHDTNAALRVWERSTRGVGHDTLRRIRQEGEPVGLRLVDFFHLPTFTEGDPLAPLLDAYDDGTIVIFDLETTGLDEQRDEIVEIAAMRLTGGRRSRIWERLVRPSIPVGASEATHGYSDDRLARDGHPPAEVLGEFLQRAAGATLVGHNIGRFDLRVIEQQAARQGLPYTPGPSLDTQQLVSRFHDQGPYSLAALAASLRLPHVPAHQAAADVATTADLLGWIVERARRGADVRRRLVMECGAEFEPLARQVADWRALMLTVRPVELLRRILDESGLSARVAGEPARVAALRELVALFAAEDDGIQASSSALQALLDHAALSRQVDLLAHAEQRIPVLTIHQAKGLEFDTVFVAGCSDGDLPRRRSVASGNIEEERRLFYVALTRAKRTLILTRSAFTDSGRPRQRSPFLAVLGDTLAPALD